MGGPPIADVRRLFASIAPVYDILNRVLSLRRDVAWRRALARRLPAGPPSRWTLDLACGTGDLAIELLRRGHRVVGADFVEPMLRRAAAKAARRGARLPLVVADAHRLPFRAGSFDAVTVAFGVRNFADRAAALGEIRRVLAAGGALGVLEFGLPRGPSVRRAYLAYFTRILPAIGRIVSGDRRAYAYLPESVLAYPPPEVFARDLEAVGFSEARWTDLTLGIAHIVTAMR